MTTDPSETIRDAHTITMNVASSIGHASGVTMSSAPAAVATPFPPRKATYGEYE